MPDLLRPDKCTFYPHETKLTLTLEMAVNRFAAMEFLRTSCDFPFSAAVIHSGRTLETVLTGIPPGDKVPVRGGAGSELREIFRQLDEILEMAGVKKTAIVSARLYLQHVLQDISEVNTVYREYFGAHPPNRRAYGVELQSGMLVEAAFVAELA